MPEEREMIQNDLRLTVQELSDSYEELSLLYRLSETLAGLDVNEICDKIVDEAISSIGVDTAAVMFLDEGMDRLFTKSFKGTWDESFSLESDGSPIWQAVMKRRPITISNLDKSGFSFHSTEIVSLLVFPMIGKKRVIGLLVVANKQAEKEYYSNDMKLLSAIARHAALFIENAVLSKEMENFLIGTIESFVKALEASSLWTAGHTERVTEYALSIGREMGLDVNALERLKICSLLHDIGKIATPKEVLDKASDLNEEEWFEMRRHPATGAEILGGLKKFTDVIECIKYHHEHYDGHGGIYGLKGEDIPLPSRILAVADAFDAMTSDRPYGKKKIAQKAVNDIMKKRGAQFDPSVVDAFKEWARKSILNVQ